MGRESFDATSKLTAFVLQTFLQQSVTLCGQADEDLHIKGRLNSIKYTAGRTLPWTKPRVGSWFVDIALTIILSVVQFSVLPGLFQGYGLVELLTPWLVAIFVMQTLGKSLVLLILGSLLLETHSAAPAGLYFCAYWMIAVAILLTRHNLSWRHRFPWLIVFTLAGSFIVLFESFLLYVTAGSARLDNIHFGVGLARIASTVLFGMTFCRSAALGNIRQEETA